MADFDLHVEAERSALEALVGKQVVLDTRGPILYVGTLDKVDGVFYHLSEADVHDIVAGRASKEIYLIDCRKNGITQNRKSVLVRHAEVVSLSLLEDVVAY